MTTQINSWYKTGTVSVTGGSAEVTGAGTSFLSQVHPGDIFTVDKSRIYEVASVTDDTALVLTEEYQGTTLSGASYFIIRFWNAGWSMNASLAQQVSALIQDVREKLDGIDAFETKVDNIEEEADVTDAENVAGSIHGTEAKTTPVDSDELPLIDSAASNVLKKLPWGALKDTLLASSDETLAGTENQKAVTPAGLTGILASDSEVLAGIEDKKVVTPAGLTSIIASLAEVLAGTEEHKIVTPNTLTNKILGTCAESGGAITGTILEYGSNANGSYIRFADGTQICWKIIGVEVASNSYTDFNWTYPAAFSTYPVSVINGIVEAAYDYFKSVVIGTNDPQFSYLRGRVISTYPSDGTSFCSIVVIGRWY